MNDYMASNGESRPSSSSRDEDSSSDYSSSSSSRPTTLSSRPTTANTLLSSPPTASNSNEKEWSKPFDLKRLSEEDSAKIWTWNGTVPDEDFRLVQDRFVSHVYITPNATALDCWDGSVTYLELDAYSTALAARLQDFGVKAGSFVPLYFEKSMWTTVAFLAVIKAGGAGVLLETSQPANRLRQICEQVDAKLMLCSPGHVDSAEELVEQVLAIDADLVKNKDNLGRFRMPPELQPSHPVVVTFTSGSTGTPKGAIMTHANVCSQLKHQSAILNYSSSMKIYDLASHAFDVSYITVLNTLCVGGCICVPSEADRKNEVEGSFLRLKANYLMITPTVLRTLTPSKIPSLKTLIIGGEPVTISDVRDWAPHVNHIVSAYGPAECTWTSTALEIKSTDTTPSIGHGVGQNTWVVDPSNPDVLVPIGQEGELVLEGPLVGAGYIANPVPNWAFVQDPAWLLQGSKNVEGRRGRIYKTGDIVRYDSSGALMFLGRKDAQVKLRGQRIELEEVEHHVRTSLGNKYPLVVEVVQPRDSDRQLLVVFIVRTGTFSGAVSAELKRKLDEAVPSYMIPTFFIPIGEIPLQLSGKTNRRLLREKGRAMTLEELTQAHLLSTEGRRQSLTTAIIMRLAQLWAQVLGITGTHIGGDSSFTDLGGDSITAIRLMHLAREHGLDLSATAILSNPILHDMASHAGESVQASPAADEGPELDQSHERYEKAGAPWNIPVDNIEALLPITHFQSYFRRGLEQTPQSWMTWMSLDFTAQVEFAGIERACQNLVETQDIMRTVLVPEDDKWRNMVLKRVDIEVCSVLTNDSIVDCAKRLQEQDTSTGFRLGDLCFRFWFIKDCHGSSRFMMRVPHTHYDGAGAILMLKSITDAYDGKPMREAGSFADVARFKSRSYTPQALEYWRSVLAGSNITQIGSPLDLRECGHGTDIKLVGVIDLPVPHLPQGITLATVVGACWAATLAQVLNHDDVNFVVLSNGRSAAARNILNCAGTCAGFMPLRVQFDGNTPKASDVLAKLQAQYLASVAYESCDVFEIFEQCTDWPAGTHCTSMLIIQTNPLPDFEIAGSKAELTLVERDWAPNPVSCFVFPTGDTLKLAFQRNSYLLDEDLAEELLQGFASRLREFRA